MLIEVCYNLFMTTNKRRHYFPSSTKPILLDRLDEKSLSVLRSLGCDIEQMRERNQVKDKIPGVVDKIRKNIKMLDPKSLQEIKTMCYVGKNPANSQPIIRPFKNKIVDLYNYVNNNPTFRSSN
jgi:hypothetical protein